VDEWTDRRIQEIHQKVCSPNPLWLITDPFALIILVTFIALTYGAYLGADGIEEAFSHAPRLESGISKVFHSTKIFGYCVMASFWFCNLAHGLEACIAVYYCQTSLKLGFVPTCQWGVLIFLVGFPIFSKVQELLIFQKENAKSK
jgi:hypothetical protein